MNAPRPRGDGRIWVKLCGFRDPDLAGYAVEAGADAIGVVVHEPSPRHATPDTVADVVDAVAPVPVVAVVVDPGRADLAALVEATGIAGLQLHGTETADDVAWVRTAYPDLFVIKAQRVSPAATTWGTLEDCGADAILVDAADPAVAGGTGRTLQWQPARAYVPVILAGGLDAANVAAAVTAAHPFGVDVSSGIEDRPGHKSATRIKEFMDAVGSIGVL